MNRLVLPLLLLLAARASGARLQGRPAPTPGKVHDSPDGRFRWVEGEAEVMVTDPAKRKTKRVPLPPAGRPAPSARRLLFAGHGRFFCVLDEYDSEVGLHLRVRRGPKLAKALVLRSTLRLVNDQGRVLWSREIPDKYAVGGAEAARSLQIAANGTLVILLHDVDPYGKARPLLLAMAPTGKELLRLDYASWTRIDAFALSADGKRLALRGWGLVPEDAAWSEALAHYVLGAGKRWVQPLADPQQPGSPAEDLRFDADGWICCVRDGGRLLRLDPSGQGKAAP